MIKCPHCEGSGKMIGFVSYAPGCTGPPVRELNCIQCKGAGEVRNEMPAWISRGEQLRRIRVDRLRLGLREAAQKWGMKPSELSNIERGTVDNLSWQPPIAGADHEGPHSTN